MWSIRRQLALGIQLVLAGVCFSGDPITDEGSRLVKREISSSGDLNVVSDVVGMKDCLDAHNALRRSHGAADLVWDESLAEGAASYAEQLAQPGSKFQHSDEAKAGAFGENLFSGFSGKRKPPYDVTDAVCSWYKENACYDYDTQSKKTGCGNGMTGHFTQVVWKASTKLGCARSTYIGKVVLSNGAERDVRYTYLVARYSPGGNIYSSDMAYYAKNVCKNHSESGLCPSSA